jgi:hypothetical protein
LFKGELTMTAPKTLIWDEHEITQAKMRDYLESGIAATENEAFELAANDHELLEYEYEDFLEAFGNILGHINKDGLFFVEGRNMGWRHLSGHLGLVAPDARAYIARAFPNTSQWTLKGTYDHRRRVLSYRLWHHDAPTGEHYTLRRGHRMRSGDIGARRRAGRA